MTETRQRRYRRPRLDQQAHARLLKEIAKFDVPPVSVQIAETMHSLRQTLAVPIADEDEEEAKPAVLVLQDAVAPSADPASATVAKLFLNTPDQAPLLLTPDDLDALAEHSIVENAPDDVQSAVEQVQPQTEPQTTPIAAPMPARINLWENLRRIPVDGGLLDRNLVITANRTDPAHASFDVMRTRLVQALADKGWKRVAITSPTKGCGKSFTAVNLAIALSRYENSRTILMDMDLRHPALAGYLGAQDVGSMGDVLRGHAPMADHLRRPGENALNIGRTLAVGFNNRPEKFASELFQQPSTGEVLRAMEQEFEPDVILYDLPPALAFDDVIAFRPQFDCVLLVVGGGITSAKEVNEVHRRLGEDKPVLGVILNMAEDDEDNTY